MCHTRLARILLGLALAAVLRSSAEAGPKQPLSEVELDRVAAGGLEVMVQGGGDPIATLLGSALVVEQVVGNNQLATEIHIVVGPEGIVSPQVVAISQERDRSDGQGAGSSLTLGDVVPKDLIQKNVMAAVVNNLMGMNQVTNSVNVQILTGGALSLPTALVGARTAGTDSLPGSTTTPSSTPAPSLLGPNAVWTPANVQSALSLLSTAAQTNPDLLGDLADARAAAQAVLTSPTNSTRRFTPPTTTTTTTTR